MPSASRSSQAATRHGKAGTSKEAAETSSQGASRDDKASGKRSSAGTNGFRRTTFATRPISSSGSALKQSKLSFGSSTASQSSLQSQSQSGNSKGKQKSGIDLTVLSSDSESEDPPVRPLAASSTSGLKRKRNRIVESQESSQGTQKAPARTSDTLVDGPSLEDDIVDDVSWDQDQDQALPVQPVTPCAEARWRIYQEKTLLYILHSL